MPITCRKESLKKEHMQEGLDSGNKNREGTKNGQAGHAKAKVKSSHFLCN